jgi:hypothetical protein
MGLGGDGDTHGIHPIHELPVIGKGRAAEGGGGLVGARSLDVGDPHDLDVFHLLIFLEVEVPEMPDPYHTHEYLFTHQIYLLYLFGL